jgi:predicted SnoaL-like aldol condensation-catalyzing enzyme
LLKKHKQNGENTVMKINYALKSVITILIFTVVASAQSADTVLLSPPPASSDNGKAVPVVAHPNPAVLLKNSNAKLAANKRVVFDMWRTVMNAGHVEQTDKFLTRDYIEHNVMANTGRDAFKAHITAQLQGKRLAKIPEQIQEPLVTIVAEGDFVVLAFVTQYPEPDGSGNTYTSTKFELFRLENGLIAEHWDSVQRVKGVAVASADQGGPAPVVGITGIDQFKFLHNDNLALANNKRLVFDLWRHIPEAGREEFAYLYLDPIYIQHNPNAVTGRDGFIEYFKKRPDSAIDAYLEDPLIVMLAEGDLVVQALQEERKHPDNTDEIYYVTWIDMFRIVDGRAAEHWDTASKGELPAVMQSVK